MSDGKKRFRGSSRTRRWLGLVGATIKLYYGYRFKMAQLEDQAQWKHLRPTVGTRRPHDTGEAR